MEQQCEASVKLGGHDGYILFFLQRPADPHIRIVNLILAESHGVSNQSGLKQGVFHLNAEFLHGGENHGIIAFLAA